MEFCIGKRMFHQLPHVYCNKVDIQFQWYPHSSICVWCWDQFSLHWYRFQPKNLYQLISTLTSRFPPALNVSLKHFFLLKLLSNPFPYFLFQLCILFHLRKLIKYFWNSCYSCKWCYRSIWKYKLQPCKSARVHIYNLVHKGYVNELKWSVA